MIILFVRSINDLSDSKSFIENNVLTDAGSFLIVAILLSIIFGALIVKLVRDKMNRNEDE
jgi:hypothetical protein